MSSSEESDVEIDCTPASVKAEANLALENLLPAKSKEKYLKAYENFMTWRNKKKANSFSETVFLAYFNEIAKYKKPSTLWAIYSMLKCTVHIKNSIDVKNYTNLTSFLKRQLYGFKSTKSKILTGENIKKFLNDAPDDKYLVTKVALILGVNGACRSNELTNITTKDIEYYNNIMIVNLHDTKTKTNRTFFVRDEFLIIVKKYQELRPMDTTSDRFFLNFKNGKCTRQVIGRHKIASMPKEIATHLNLPTPECYTGHCFRRSSATLLAESGANLTTLKMHGVTANLTKWLKATSGTVENKNGIERKFLKKGAVPTVFPWSYDSADGLVDRTVVSSAMQSNDDNEVSFVQRRVPLRTYSSTKGLDNPAPIPIFAKSFTSTLNDAEHESLSVDSCCISCLCKHEQRRLQEYSVLNEPLRRIFQTDNLTLCYVCHKFASRVDEFVTYVQNNQRYLALAGNEESASDDTKPNFKSIVELTTKYFDTEDFVIKFGEKPDDRSSQRNNEFEPKSYSEPHIKEEIIDNSDDPLQNPNTDTDQSEPAPYEIVTVKIETVSDHDQSHDETTDNDGSQQDTVFPITLIQTLPKITVRKNIFTTPSDNEDEKRGEVKRTPKKRQVGITDDESCDNKDGEGKETPSPLKKRNRSKVKYEDGNEDFEEDDGKKRNDSYESIRITKEQSLEELAESAKDPKYMEAPFKCSDCVKGYIMKSLYEEHMLLHEQSRGEYSCQICKLRFPSTKALCHHFRKHLLRFKCRACDFIRKNACSVIEHYQKEHRKQTNDCAVCGKALATKKSLKRHMKYVHTRVEDRITCEYCNNTFKCKYILKNHLANMHTELVSSADFDINRHKCPHCTRGFTVASRLKRHIMQKHTEFPDYYCQQCEKYFRTKDSLKNHEKSDPGHVFKHKKPFQCDYCGRRFRRKVDVKNHIVSVHLRRNLVKCVICKKECRGEAGHAYHMRAVHGDGIQRSHKLKELHECKFCCKTFLGEKWLNNHLKKNHESEHPAVVAEDEEAAAFDPADVVETEYGADES